MREIKFRAWHKDNKSFDYFGIKEIWKNGWICSEGHHEATDSGFLKKIPTSKEGVYADDKWLNNEIKSTFIPSCDAQQYTGLLDKNGKEIYEGDIVKVLKDKDDEIFLEQGWIEYNAPLFQLVGHGIIGGKAYSTMCAYPLEIIGNIMQNSELLK